MVGDMAGDMAAMLRVMPAAPALMMKIPMAMMMAMAMAAMTRSTIGAVSSTSALAAAGMIIIITPATVSICLIATMCGVRYRAIISTIGVVGAPITANIGRVRIASKTDPRVRLPDMRQTGPAIGQRRAAPTGLITVLKRAGPTGPTIAQMARLEDRATPAAGLVCPAAPAIQTIAPMVLTADQMVLWADRTPMAPWAGPMAQAAGRTAPLVGPVAQAVDLTALAVDPAAQAVDLTARAVDPMAQAVDPMAQLVVQMARPAVQMAPPSGSQGRVLIARAKPVPSAKIGPSSEAPVSRVTARARSMASAAIPNAHQKTARSAMIGPFFSFSLSVSG